MWCLYAKAKQYTDPKTQYCIVFTWCNLHPIIGLLRHTELLQAGTVLTARSRLSATVDALVGRAPLPVETQLASFFSTEMFCRFLFPHDFTELCIRPSYFRCSLWSFSLESLPSPTHKVCYQVYITLLIVSSQSCTSFKDIVEGPFRLLFIQHLPLLDEKGKRQDFVFCFTPFFF